MIVLHLFMNKTKLGTAMRASSMDSMAAESCGINVSLTTGITWGVSAMLAVMAGILIGPMYGVYSSLGANLGNKGFLAELEQTETDCILEVADGHYTVQTRMMLDLKLFRKGELVYEGSALNEAVVRASVSVVKLEAFSDGREVTAFSGDGMIASTPTGSTAYSMAAGGPIVEPCADCIILTPICTFRLAARSYVLKADREVSIRTVEQGDKEVFLSVDGVAVPFLDGDELVVARSDKTLLMARVKDRSFFDIVFEKLVDK